MLDNLTSTDNSPPAAETLAAIKKFHIVLIKPSKYDDDGYVIRFWKGVLPSNTLNVLHGLTEDIKSGAFSAIFPSKLRRLMRPPKKSLSKKSSAGGRNRERNCSSAWSAYRPTSSPAPGHGESFPPGEHSGHHGRLSHQRHDQHARATRSRTSRNSCTSRSASFPAKSKANGKASWRISQGRLKPIYSFAQDFKVSSISKKRHCRKPARRR